MKAADLLVLNIGKLITCSTHGTNAPKVKASMSELNIIKDAGVAIRAGRIFDIGKTSSISKSYKTESEIDAKGKLVSPGFVDPHTHLVYAGIRDADLKLRLKGATYLEILQAGGGIHSTVKATREATFNTLYNESLEKIKSLLKHGTTCVEIKSGYGLDYETEEKILKVIKSLKDENLIDIVSTYLGAHTYPKDITHDEYLDLILNKCLPDFKDLAAYCDVYSETNAFTRNEAFSILSRAKSLGYKLKIHSGQFSQNGSTLMASELGANSCDHLDNTDAKDLEAMIKNRTAAVLMPAANFYLFDKTYPKARKFIDAGVLTALATDFNPGSAPCFSMQFIINLAVLHMGMSVEEAISASTINSAYAIGKNATNGSIEVGKAADLNIFDINEPIEIPYYFGCNLISQVIKGGNLIN